MKKVIKQYLDSYNQLHLFNDVYEDLLKAYLEDEGNTPVYEVFDGVMIELGYDY